MKRIYGNNASSTLATVINNTDDPVVFSVALGAGAQYPQPVVGQEVFVVSLEDASGAIEYVEVTERVGDQFTANRAVEGSSLTSFSIGDRCDHRSVAGDFIQFAQLGAPIDMGGNALSGANCDSTCTWDGGAMRAGVYRAEDGGALNAITVPDGGQRPHIDNDPIVTESQIGVTTPEAEALYKDIYFIGIVIFVNSNANPNDSAPSGVLWQQLTAARGEYLVADTIHGPRNASNIQTDAGGAHDHGGATGGHALTEAELPTHNHSIYSGADKFYVSGPGPGIPTASGTPIGANPAPRDTGFVGSGQTHSHNIAQSQEHTHGISYLPSAYRLVAWTRVS